MAREITFHCDICKKPTKQIVGKLNFVPVIPGISRAVHTITRHMPMWESAARIESSRRSASGHVSRLPSTTSRRRKGAA